MAREAEVRAAEKRGQSRGGPAGEAGPHAGGVRGEARRHRHVRTAFAWTVGVDCLGLVLLVGLVFTCNRLWCSRERASQSTYA